MQLSVKKKIKVTMLKAELPFCPSRPLFPVWDINNCQKTNENYAVFKRCILVLFLL